MPGWRGTVTVRAGPRRDAGQSWWHGSRHSQAAPFYTGDVGRAVSDWVRARGGMITGDDLAAYAVVRREPLQVEYRGREVFTNPPPSAGGGLGRALATLDARTPGTGLPSSPGHHLPQHRAALASPAADE
jgi:gamma-glutamyltranspeptidase